MRTLFPTLSWGCSTPEEEGDGLCIYLHFVIFSESPLDDPEEPHDFQDTDNFGKDSPLRKDLALYTQTKITLEKNYPTPSPTTSRAPFDLL